MDEYVRASSRGYMPSQEDFWELTRELESERAKFRQVEAQLLKKNDILREMTMLQEELYENLDELQARISDLQTKKSAAQEA
jgi:predicted transcriptional regulator